MQYLGKLVNGQATRNNFIRSMDIMANRDPDAALARYSQAWFSSTKKQYLNEALKNIKKNSLFWPKHALPDMLDEILVDFEGSPDETRQLARDVDVLKSKFQVWATKRKNQPISDDAMTELVKNFERDHKYRCPDTFRNCWMNTGAYITLCYGIKYEGLRLPGCDDPDQCIAVLKKCALEALESMDHDVDERMFRLCHALYLRKLVQSEQAGLARPVTAD